MRFRAEAGAHATDFFVIGGDPFGAVGTFGKFAVFGRLSGVRVDGGTMEGKNLHEVELIVDGGNRGLGSFGLGGWLGRALATATSFGWADGWWCSRGGWCLFQLLAACFPFVRSDCRANKVVVGWTRCLRFGWDAFCC